MKPLMNIENLIFNNKLIFKLVTLLNVIKNVKL